MRRPRAPAVFALAATMLAAPAQGQERYRTIGDFAVVIDKDPLTLDSNVTATVRRSGRMFGIRCLEGKLSMAVGSSLAGETFAAGDGVKVRVQIDDHASDEFVGRALNENEVVIADAGAVIARLRGAASASIAIQTQMLSYSYRLAVGGADIVARRVLTACGD